MEILGLIVAVLPLLVNLLGLWLDKKPEREKQNVREAVVKDDAIAVSVVIDGLCGADSAGKKQSDASTAEHLGRVLGEVVVSK
jgi:hypothetical protein